jgi:hypothetical protein
VYVETNGFEIGDVARDTITGFEGTIVGITQWTTGCARASLQTKVDKDGKVPDSVGVDVLILELVKAGPRRDVDRSMGGPMPEPTRVADASRGR